MEMRLFGFVFGNNSKSHKCAFQLKPLEQYLKPIKKELLLMTTRDANNFSTFIFIILT